MLIMLDGVRPDALSENSTPAICAFKHVSAWSMNARTIFPSITLPCHSSLFHSVPPQLHGVWLNNQQPRADRPLSLPDLVARSGGVTDFYIDWAPLEQMARSGSLRRCVYRADCVDPSMDDAVCADAIAGLQSAAPPDFVFVYFGTVDEEGHRSGWMSEGYLKQLARVDGLVGQLMAVVPAHWHVLMQADHGGHGKSHGTPLAADMTIPWMLRGPTVLPGEIASLVSILDSAPTLARAMGLQAPADWQGRAQGFG